jgi:outer membrane protein assembly factor BamB
VAFALFIAARFAQAPVPGGVDPTAWLPDEILEHVLSLLSPVDQAQARYLTVCRRWRSAGVTTRMGTLRERSRWTVNRWIAYSTSMIAPKALAAHEGVEWSEHAQITAIGPDGTVYSGGVNGAIWVWAPTTHAPLRILGTAPGIQITALVVAADGTVFAGATSGTIYAFSGVDGAPLHNWVVANGTSVAALALAPDDTMVYSMTSQLDVTAWSTDLGVAGALRTLIVPGMGAAVAPWAEDASLAVGPDGTVYGAIAE